MRVTAAGAAALILATVASASVPRLVHAGAGTTVPWRVTFAQRDGATYVEYETALGPTRVRRHRYSRVIVAFENVRAVRAFDTGLSTFVPEHTLLVREPPE